MHGTDRVADLAAALREEAREADERRLLALHGPRERTLALADAALDAADLDREAVPLVARRAALDCERVAPREADRLLGTTSPGLVLDLTDTCAPNALGQVAGVVDGGGLLVLLCPSLADWPAADCAFHRSLAVPPATVDAVTARYHDRLAALLRAHRGVAVVDAADGTVETDGLTDPAPRRPPPAPEPPADPGYPTAVYRACLTADQAEAVAALECLREPGAAAVLEADRGRGKSAAAGLAAGALAAAGETVLVTAPDRAGTRALFERARALLVDLGALAAADTGGPDAVVAAGGGRVTYVDPEAAAERAGEADVLLVDEAAGLPVRRLEAYLAADRVAFVTTVHGYEGTGRGFEVRFRDRLAETDRPVTEVTLTTPVRYAAGDPVEVWATRTLALDARPPVTPLVADARPETVRPAAPDAATLAADEGLLRAVFGLLVEAHYRTEPADLARLLDAPNVEVRTLVHGTGQTAAVVSVALLAAEGGLDAATRADIYEGARVAGNMLPDVFASQLRDEAAAEPRGRRVLRIATHRAARSRGLGSRLLTAVAEAHADDIDWLGVGFGATPRLLRFWAANGYGTVHLATTRNDTSGEYSALLLRPCSPAGRALQERLATWFLERIPAVLADALGDLDPDVVRAALRATDATPTLDLAERDWRVVAGAGHGPGLYDVDPRPFRRLAMAHLVDPVDPALLDAGAERLLVRKVLQAHDWETVAAELGYHSRAECMRALGRAYAALADAYGGETVTAERERYR